VYGRAVSAPTTIYFPKVSSRFSIPRLGYVKLRDKLNKELRISAGLFRKFANHALERLAHEHNIRLDAVNLILSRELSVIGEHYLNTRYWADKLFSIYVDWLRKNALL